MSKLDRLIANLEGSFDAMPNNPRRWSDVSVRRFIQIARRLNLDEDWVQEEAEKRRNGTHVPYTDEECDEDTLAFKRYLRRRRREQLDMEQFK